MGIKTMEKKVIIDFLDEHWEEFITLLTDMEANRPKNTLSKGIFPQQVSEFADMLSKILADHQKLNSGKGLLKKAQTLRKKLCENELPSFPIAVKNGLFVVQPQKHHEALNTAFKNLVDSVL